MSGFGGQAGKHAVIAPTWIGDTAMAAPFFAALRGACPDARIEVISTPWTEGLLRVFPWVDAVHTWGGGAGGRKWSAFMASRRYARRAAPDVLWLLPNSFRTAALGRWMGVRRRIGYAADGRGWLLTDAVPPPPGPSHLVDYYLGLLEAAGVSPAERDVRLPVPPDAAAFADRLMAEIGFAGSAPIVGIHPGAFYGDSKTWPPGLFSELIRKLALEDGFRILVMGGPGEVALAEEICTEAQGAAVNVAGRDSLATLPGVLSRLSVLVSGDTGPLHVASLVGVPTVSLFGPTDPSRTAPRGGAHRIIRRELDCSPCFARTCPLGHHRCMIDISPGEVAEEVRGLIRMIRETPPPVSRAGEPPA